MEVECLTREDEEILKRIWKEYYSTEFAFPDFFKNFLCAFKFTDNNGDIITAGGVRTEPELVLVTDKAYGPKIRTEALLSALAFSKRLCERYRYPNLYATCIPGTAWEKQLRKHNFVPIKDKMLNIRIGVD